MGKVVVRTSEIVGDMKEVNEVEWESAEDYIDYCNTLLEADMNIDGYTGEEFIIDLDGCGEDCVACQEIELDEQEQEEYDGGERYGLLLTEDEAYTLQVLLGSVRPDAQSASISSKLEDLTGFEPDLEDWERMKCKIMPSGEEIVDFELFFTEGEV